MSISLAGFKEFASKQSGHFEYTISTQCAFAQYLHSLGYENARVSVEFYRLDYKDIECHYQKDIHPDLWAVLLNVGSID